MNQERKDRRYIEDVRSTYSPVVPLDEIDRLLAAQGRLEYQRGVEDAIQKIIATHETDTIWKLVTIKNVRSLLPPNHD